MTINTHTHTRILIQRCCASESTPQKNSVVVSGGKVKNQTNQNESNECSEANICF